MLDILKNIRTGSEKLTTGIESICDGLEVIDFSSIYSEVTVEDYNLFKVGKLTTNIESAIVEILNDYIEDNYNLVEDDIVDFNLTMNKEEFKEAVICRFFLIYNLSICELFITILMANNMKTDSKVECAVKGSKSKYVKPSIVGYIKMHKILHKLPSSKVVQDQLLKDLTEISIKLRANLYTGNLTDLNNLFKSEIKSLKEGHGKMSVDDLEFLSVYLCRDNMLDIYHRIIELSSFDITGEKVIYNCYICKLVRQVFNLD